MGFRLMHLFEELNRLGTTVVIATHNMKVVESLGHGRLLLDDGQLKMESAITKIDPKAKSLAEDNKNGASVAVTTDPFGELNNDSKTFSDPSNLETSL